MAISRMQEPQQIQSGIGSLQDPRQGYFLGKLVKKAGRAVKKIVKSPIGKAAIIGGLGYLGGGGTMFNKSLPFLKARTGGFSLANLGANLGLGSFGPAGQFKAGNLLSKFNDLSLGKKLFLGAGAASIAAPFLMGGGDEEVEEVEVMDPAFQTQRAKNYYSGRGDAGAGLDFMPQKKYVMQNFYAADGGRAGFEMGGLGALGGAMEKESEYITKKSNTSETDTINRIYEEQGGDGLSAYLERNPDLKDKYVIVTDGMSGELTIMENKLHPDFMNMDNIIMLKGDDGNVIDMSSMFEEKKAKGGRVGYQDGMMVEDDEEEEYMRTGAGQSRRMPKTFLNMGGDAGQAQAEQMLMMEYVKYKNKGGTLSFEQFVKAVMQEAAPEGAGMEQPQPVMMAANGGPVPDSTVPGYTTPAGYNKFDYRSGGVPVRVGAQEGGIMETEVSEEIMPLLDMDGKEKDYRNTGGFVELGRKERADDVPARLSKNEFVFTADAVRNAGGGDIDRGAEVMENLMNNLEQGGEVSEDSQGLEGAQAMYEQQQMLQSRIV